ncbi:MAG TPA: sugar phosphate isomerase/epimerase [Gemmatimonadaceae bacterium]|nr:sugar phosphate isomerase/epimerase [Gemmatimonadaceae bacterium]
MQRRAFVYSIGTSLAGATLARRFRLNRPAKRLARIGLELYSVRDAMRRDPERTLAAVRATGYTDVELLWTHGNFGRTPAQVRATLDSEGLRAPSAHIDPTALEGDWARSLETAKTLGHDSLIVPSLPAETQRSLDAWRAWADRFNRAGVVARRAGIWLAFHNEPDHMKAIDHTVPYDLFLEHTDPSVVRLQLDTGNMVMGGGDPMRYLQTFGDRYWSFHIKDVAADGVHDTELGAGRFDLRGFLSGIADIGRKPCYVEQEEASDPLASAQKNCAFLKTLEF